MKLSLTAAADGDLASIYAEGIEQHGVVAADAYYDRLLHAFGLIADNPKLARLRTEIQPPVRAHPCGVHVILYDLMPEEVMIVRIRHSREDWVGAPF